MAYRRLAGAVALGMLMAGNAMAGDVQVFHADSLAGPMRALKQAFEAKHPGVTIHFTPGVSKQLAARIEQGETCDVFAPSSPAVADDLMSKKIIPGYVVFSANEMVVITKKGNPLGIHKVEDIAKPGVKFVRVTGEKDLGTGRTVEFLKRETKAESKPDLAEVIVAKAPADAEKPRSVPDTVRAIKEGAADAGVVYYSAAIAAKNDVDIIRFPAAVNMSEAIRNAAAIPNTAKNPKEAAAFIGFILGTEGQHILLENGQPPVVPPLRKGDTGTLQ